ncbi:protein of unknown function [Taphrina deformans PYCC 5710]|uniref:PSP1 C-terminal domain-containing protein n=1 Tax=Taphrina deformans (strain PYCC 5710 / ATCC 11124 / CBS 356.35 / IMI 108563 / JCM 9778 / NBRC 8474) TaxID=1097556 RepID=R4XGT8_TAPDE|nr:protein of unknown function [Taphrina deformans PYCC 5710]|eukprot:CCG85102.1 protein of unknown function [Taphrina deformans PYCC 5710]
MQEVENAIVSSGSTSSEDDDREHSIARRRDSGASQERWAESISSSSIGPSIWGSHMQTQERGRASRSASFSVGQEQSKAVNSMSALHMQEPQEIQAYDQTRLLREQFQQMKFKNRSKSSYAAAWHVPEFDEVCSSDNAIMDEDDSISRFRNNDPPGLRYTTPSNPRVGTLRDRERRSSFNSTVPQNSLDFKSHIPVAETAKRESYNLLPGPGPEMLSRDSLIQHLSIKNQDLQTNDSPIISGTTEGYSTFMADVDRYFSCDDHRTRTRTHLAQTAAAQSALMTQPYTSIPSGLLYIVEFKACRTDVFYVAEGSGLRVNIGDLVIVEADRGRDLGKVIRENVSLAQVRALKAQQAREQAMAMGGQQDETEKINFNNIQPKLIYRLSQPSEIKCGCKSLRPPHFRLQSST